MSLRSLTTCSYVSDATCFAMRHCTIVVTPLPMSPEPESFRSRDFIMDLHGPDVGIIENGACRWWLIDGCKSLFNVKPSTVPTRLIHELYAHTRTAHPERFLGAETPQRPNTLRHVRAPFKAYRKMYRDTALFTGERGDYALGVTGRPVGARTLDDSSLDLRWRLEMTSPLQL